MYLIGEILNKFTKDSIAYCTKGVFKDAFIMCDQNDENRLFKLNPNGEIDDEFYFGITDEPIEDKKQWVLINEIEDLEQIQKVNKVLSNSIIESLKKGYELTLVEDDEN